MRKREYSSPDVDTCEKKGRIFKILNVTMPIFASGGITVQYSTTASLIRVCRLDDARARCYGTIYIRIYTIHTVCCTQDIPRLVTVANGNRPSIMTRRPPPALGTRAMQHPTLRPKRGIISLTHLLQKNSYHIGKATKNRTMPFLSFYFFCVCPSVLWPSEWLSRRLGVDTRKG